MKLCKEMDYYYSLPKNLYCSLSHTGLLQAELRFCSLRFTDLISAVVECGTKDVDVVYSAAGRAIIFSFNSPLEGIKLLCLHYL